VTARAKRPPALVDNHGRRITYLRLSITDLCNLRCFYCMPEGIVNKLSHDEVLRHEEHLEVVRAAASLGFSKVRITGGEPLVKRGVVGLVHSIFRTEGIEQTVMTTNGQRLVEMAEPLRVAGLQGLNVSLDSLDAETYGAITRGGDLRRVLDGISAAIALGFPIKINTVLLRGTNTADLASFVEFAGRLGIGLRFIERMGFETEQPLFTQDEAIASLSERYRVEELDLDGAHPHVRRFSVGGLDVGFISPMTHVFCGSCNKLRLQPDGSLRVCLASEEAVDVRAILRRPHEPEEVAEAIRRAVALKPAAASWNAPSEMWKVGG